MNWKKLLFDLAWMVAIIGTASIYRDIDGPFPIGVAVGLAMWIQELRLLPDGEAK